MREVILFSICCAISVTTRTSTEFWHDYAEKDSLRKHRDVCVTFYHPEEAQCDSTPLCTADMSVIDVEKLEGGELRWIAVSRDLKQLMGDSVYLKSDNKNIEGSWVVHDLMNRRFKNRVDILTHKKHTKKYGKDKAELFVIGL